jgi:apolipoprotein N-acyltransferase
MNDAAAVPAPYPGNHFIADASARRPTLAELCLVVGSALLLVLSFPDFELWPLAWIALVPFFLVIARPMRGRRAFLLGWVWGATFFYGTCWWLTYPMIHYAHISAWLAYPLLVLPIALVGLFPALFSLLLSRLIAHFGLSAIFAAPLIWVATELARYAVTGQLWNALGYSQAFHPFLIQAARWGGVYAVSFLLITTSAAITFALIRHDVRGLALALPPMVFVLLVVAPSSLAGSQSPEDGRLAVVAVQPNVPMDGPDDSAAMESLLNRHLELSVQGMPELPDDVGSVRLVIWPESPMNFSYSRDPHLREVVGNFARKYSTKLHTLVLLNSLEPSPNGGESNSAVMINEEGRIVAQYDKIRLMPFGEYVPLPHWLPGASSVRGIVGDFTPGSAYTLMPLGAIRAGVFICIEAAHPSIARTFANESAGVLINISNDGYLGPTPVMRQHLSNAIFRAVENGRPLIRVTNSGISAFIESDGRVSDSTRAFAPAVQSRYVVGRKGKTFYTRQGDMLAYACALITVGFISATFMSKRKRLGKSLSEARP